MPFTFFVIKISKRYIAKRLDLNKIIGKNLQKNLTAIRLNVSKKIGLGHLRRSQALATVIGPHLFIVPKEGKNIALQQGIPDQNLLTLTDDSCNWWEAIPKLTHIVTDIMNTGNKTAAGTEITKIAQSPHKLAVIDSMPPDHYVPKEGDSRPDLIIRPYYTSEIYLKKVHELRYLTGVQYAILSDKFGTARQNFVPDKSPRILLTCGGTDPNELSLKILRSLSPAPCKIDLVIGPLYSHSLCKKLLDFSTLDKKIEVHQNVLDMIPFYKSATLVVGRPGLTRYEAAVFGCHGLYLWDAKGYENYWKSLTKSGLAEIYTSAKAGDSDAFFERLLRLSKHLDDVPVALNKKASELVDGLGGQRVAKEILRLNDV